MKFFKKEKNIVIFSFQKKVNINWSWKKVYEGQINVQFVIGIPKFSYISVPIVLKTKYSLSIDLSAKGIIGYPYIFQAKALIE